MATGSGSANHAATSEEASESSLFLPPRDLICPITQNLFVDPVVNSVGQIYERQALVTYLEGNDVKLDPVSRQPVDPAVLTSIYAVKARASEYREETARACVELASHSEVPLAMKYLKRAAELSSETDLQIPGLGRGTIGRILRQSSTPGYSTPILMSFAEDLMKDGQCDRAAEVYYTLLKVGDREIAQQPELLKCCIDCWAGRTDVETGEDVSLEKLLEFVENQKAFSWGEIVDIMHHSGIDNFLILSLCESLIQKDVEDLALWKMQKEVMMKYLQMRLGGIYQGQESLRKEVQVLMDWKERTLRSKGFKPKMAVPLSVLKERRKPFFLKKRFISSVIIGILEMAHGGRWLGRLARTSLILYLLNSA